jgi:hypothetical protein
MVVQAGANSNVFGYNYSTAQVWNCGGGCPDGSGPDICIHGNYPFANLFEENEVVMIMADGEHGQNGPYNTFFRNRTHDKRESILWNSDRVNFVGNANSAGADTDLDDIFEMIGNIFSPRQVRPSMEVIDVYTNLYTGDSGSTPVPVSHRSWKQMNNDEQMENGKNSFLTESSYYYTSRPEFMEGYTWPPFGPHTSLDAAEQVNRLPQRQGLPARERHENGKYTWIAAASESPCLVPGLRPEFLRKN